jgi:glucose/arabinose dehydrogenase
LAAAPNTASGEALVPIAPPEAWFDPPIHAAAPPGDPRLFVVEQAAAERLVKGGELQPTPFLIVPDVHTFGERGLMSIAFSPDYTETGRLYVFYAAIGADVLDPSGAEGDLRVVEYPRSASDPDIADPSSARLVLKQPHTHTNHNGGQLAFGPDGFLYITIGDGVLNPMNAQDPGTYLGKLPRIDPRDPPEADTQSVPASNPFVGVEGARPEIYALGLRNPYRASFTSSGALVVPDVGEATWEEVNAGHLLGKNLGWPTCEATCSPPHPDFTDPIFQYPHGDDPDAPEATGCAVIGGYVVRDESLSDLTGRYLYGDFCRPDLRTLDLDVASGDPRPANLSIPPFSLRGFGEDAGRCVYVMTNATVYRVAPDAAAPRKCPTAPTSPGPVTPVDSGSGPVSRTGTAATDTTRPGLRFRSGRQKLATIW